MQSNLQDNNNNDKNSFNVSVGCEVTFTTMYLLQKNKQILYNIITVVLVVQCLLGGLGSH